MKEIKLTPKEAIDIFLDGNEKYLNLENVITKTYYGDMTTEYLYDVIFEDKIRNRMRNPKFRVWCNKTKRLYSNVDRLEWLISGHVIRAMTIVSEEEEHRMSNGYDGLPNHNKVNFILQQYIGIRDIHGKEIYEGDYCKVLIPCSPDLDRDNFAGNSMRIVASILCFKLYWQRDTKDVELDDDYRYIDIDEDLVIEVVGNIYQSDIDIIQKAAHRDFKIDEILE